MVRSQPQGPGWKRLQLRGKEGQAAGRRSGKLLSVGSPMGPCVTTGSLWCQSGGGLRHRRKEVTGGLALRWVLEPWPLLRSLSLSFPGAQVSSATHCTLSPRCVCLTSAHSSGTSRPRPETADTFPPLGPCSREFCQ